MSDPPLLQNVSATNLGYADWELDGDVIDSSGSAGLTVFIWGLVEGTASTAADGSFSFTFSLDPMAMGGTIYVQAYTADGVASNIVEVYVSNS